MALKSIRKVHSLPSDDVNNSTVMPVYKTVKNERSRKVQEEWNTFVGTCTLHGLHYVFERNRCRLKRTLWLLCIVVGIGWFCFQAHLLLIKYFSHPVQTKVMLVYETNPVFPAVTICSFSPFKRSRVKDKYKEMLNYSSTLHKKGSSIGNASHTFSWDRFNFTGLNMTKEYIESGFPMEDFMVECAWSGSNCSTKNFTTSITGLGLCYTFNSGT